MNIILTPLSQVLFFITGVEVQADQLIFLSTLFISLIGSFAYKHFLQPSSVPLEVQLLLTSLFGIWIFYLNWGWYIWVPLFDVVGSYLIVRWTSPLVSHKYVFLFTMSVLSACHLHTLYLFMYGVAGDTSADYTSPMMVITQRLTSLSFSIADGFTRNPDSLSDNQKQHAVRKIPSFIEYFSYSFCFLGIMAGPLVFYNYFMECMKGGKEQKQAPSALVPVVMKWLVGVGFISCYVVGGRYFPALRNA
uniref:Uncharacterized protein n=1 Tax=Ciona savignyi TaxID=51511 RepID=H2YG28_CIOSA